MRELPSPANSELISWVRWIPDAPFPVARLVTKYGKPEVSDFSKDNFKPFKEWKKRGIQAFLDDEGNNVVRIDFDFTKKEQDEAFKRKYPLSFREETKDGSSAEFVGRFQEIEA